MGTICCNFCSFYGVCEQQQQQQYFTEDPPHPCVKLDLF